MSSHKKSDSLNRFVVRYAVREVFKNGKGEMECAIALTDSKTVVSEADDHKSYAKIAGLLNLKDMNGDKVKELLPKLDSFGYHLVMSNFRTTKGSNTYAVVCPQMKGRALEDVMAPLVSFLPRINGRTGSVICGLRISSGDQTRDRKWTRFEGSAKANAFGFHELNEGFDYDSDFKQKTHAKYAGLYVGRHTSLVLYDMGVTDPTKPANPEQNRTLIQEGGFVYADADLVFRFCEDSEADLLTAKQVFERFKDKDKSFLGSDKYKKSHLIRDKEPNKRSIILFLKGSPLLLPFELHVTEDLSRDPLFKDKRTVVLCVPSGGELEYSEFWPLNDGIKAVQKRQSQRPWLRYLQKTSDVQNSFFEDKIKDIPIQSFPIEGISEQTPQNDEIYRKIKKARKGGKSGNSSGGSGRSGSVSQKLQTQTKEAKPESPEPEAKQNTSEKKDSTPETSAPTADDRPATEKQKKE